ncbi:MULTISPECIES: minor capsid protein [Dehalobacter]|uniref:phage tail terminator protein n=1 Tax=Dehalobacter TaxID=56112 RepID=UPI00258FFA58|nr:minor capsid protein [Dehalobacter sp.]MDJ0305390.1 minor capsid protein [Dehalobacter sp.]
MSIIKALQDYLKTYEGMNLQPLATDMAGTVVSKYALAPSGNGKTVTDIIGNKTFENNYVFYAKEAAANEVDRQDNYDFLEGLSDWLDEQNDADNFPELPTGYDVESIEVSNAMLFDIDEDGTGLYQVQIKLKFTKKKG